MRKSNCSGTVSPKKKCSVSGALSPGYTSFKKEVKENGRNKKIERDAIKKESHF